MTTGQRIAQKRKELELSQEALGAELGVSRQSIYKWESDAALPEIDKLVALSRRFNVTVGWLLGVEQEIAESAEAKEDTSRDNAQKVELTEEQLKMVEEIVDRYITAQPTPPKRRRWPAVLAAAILTVVSWSLLGRVNHLNDLYNGLQNSLLAYNNSVRSQVDAVSTRVEEILKQQNALTADCGLEISQLDLTQDGGTVTFSVYAVPKTYMKGMTVEFIAENGEISSNVSGEVGADGPEQRFSAAVSIPLSDVISVSAVFVQPDGTRQTQLLNTYTDLPAATMPQVSVDWYSVNGQMDGETLTLPAQVVVVTPYEQYYTYDLPEQTRIVSMKVGLFHNKTLIAWGTPTDTVPDGYTLQEGARLFQFPELTFHVEEGDLIETAALVTDQYGRELICQSDFPSVVDLDTGLGWPDGDSQFDPDPSHWTLS